MAGNLQVGQDQLSVSAQGAGDGFGGGADADQGEDFFHRGVPGDRAGGSRKEGRKNAGRWQRSAGRSGGGRHGIGPGLKLSFSLGQLLVFQWVEHAIFLDTTQQGQRGQ